MCVSMLSHVWLFATRLDFVALQAPLSVGFSRQEYWSGLPWPPPGDLPSPGIKPASPTLAGGFFTTVPPGKPRLVDFYFVFWVIVQYYFILLLTLFQLWPLGALLVGSCLCVFIFCHYKMFQSHFMYLLPSLRINQFTKRLKVFLRNWRMVLDIRNGIRSFIFNLSWVPVCKMGFLQIAYSWV